MEKETKKRKGGAEKVREKKRALEADAAKSKKIREMFSAGPQQPVAGPTSDSALPPLQEEQVVSGFSVGSRASDSQREKLLLAVRRLTVKEEEEAAMIIEEEGLLLLPPREGGGGIGDVVVSKQAAWCGN